MNTRADKTQNNNSKAAANNVAKQQGNGLTAQLTDNRPEALAQLALQEMANNSAVVKQQKAYQDMANNHAPKILQPKKNNTGMPDRLKSGIENLSGYSMDDVNVHYNSDKPAQLQAYAYAGGTDIHIAPGQEKHLPHEAWHVVQQKQGRVKPTIQLKGQINLNDDQGLEKEADIQGSLAASIGETLQHKKSPPLSDTSPKESVVQRVIRFGKPYVFVTSETAGQLDADLGDLVEHLEPLISDINVHGFTDLADIRSCAEILRDNPDFLAIVKSRIYGTMSAATEPFHFKLRRWMLGEIIELRKTIDTSRGFDALNANYRALAGALKADKIVELVTVGLPLLTEAQKNMFKLEDRETQYDDGTGDTENQAYGYHLTKIHNINGIKAKGLDPTEGAGVGGSLAMSTAEQRVGSEKTSKNKIAFGHHPSTFRPYINQFEDRRQMIEGAPEQLKPIMLRFLISPEVRKNSMALVAKGDVDFMDASARNSQMPILARDIEVLTSEGWVPISEYTAGEDVHELRSGDDNERQGNEWEDQTAIFTYDELLAINGIDLFAFGARAAERGASEQAQLEAARDQVIGTHKDVTYTFRGATMQTSGHKKTWEYAFGVSSTKKLPSWLDKHIGLYAQNYKSLAGLQMGTIKPKTPKKERAPISMDAIEVHFRVGVAQGNELNCLLETVDQLYRNAEGSNADNVAAMREVLSSFDLAPAAGMIDIYGGAGMQLANDLNLRIQVIQNTGGGNFIEHPIMGVAGRLVQILHTPGHFQPLWPR